MAPDRFRDELFMREALRLARIPPRSPYPNPRVGAVVVQGGRLVGRGWHVGPGSEHAEEMAIRRARFRTRGATLYCTLEPCVHSGSGKRRPPCVPLVIASGITRLVLGQVDPNPRVNGCGIQALQKAGIRVRLGILAPVRGIAR